MGAQIREYRQRIRSVSATKKITRAMELMAASRVVKAQQAVRESSPYARALTRAASAVATSAKRARMKLAQELSDGTPRSASALPPRPGNSGSCASASTPTQRCLSSGG